MYVSMARRIEKVISGRKYVRVAFERLKGSSGRILVLFSATLFSYADFMIDLSNKNKIVMQAVRT